MVRPAMALPRVPRAAKPTIRPERPADASNPAEITRNAWNWESTTAVAVTQITICASRRNSVSWVAVSGNSVPRWRWRSKVRLNPMLIARERMVARIHSTSAVTTCLGCSSEMSVLQNDGAAGATASREEITAPEG